MTLHSAPINLAAGYYGKLPLVGDFVSRRVPQHILSAWDQWLRQGLFGLKNDQNHTGLPEQYHTKPVWNFVLPPAICGELLIGVIGASGDRVGRKFPFTVFRSLTPDVGNSLGLEHIAPFFIRHGSIIRAIQMRQIGMDQIEYVLDAASDWLQESMLVQDKASDGDIFSVISNPVEDSETTIAPQPGRLMPWPGLALSEIVPGVVSYWWTNQAAGGPLRAFTHTGALNETLFKIIFSSNI